MLWFDIEQCDDPGCWNDLASNAQWIQTAVNAANSKGVNVGK